MSLLEGDGDVAGVSSLASEEEGAGAPSLGASDGDEDGGEGGELVGASSCDVTPTTATKRRASTTVGRAILISLFLDTTLIASNCCTY